MEKCVFWQEEPEISLEQGNLGYLLDIQMKNLNSKIDMKVWSLGEKYEIGIYILELQHVNDSQGHGMQGNHQRGNVS